jgi:glycosyltransferase involved in cell wall biosynthesis
LEVIVVDDHSEDGTLDYLREKFSDKVITVTNQGKGPGAARNTGVAIATGEYIKFFDSDDLMSSNTLAQQSVSLENSSAGFLYSPYFRANLNSRGHWENPDSIIMHYYPFDADRPLNYHMVRGLFIAIPGMLFRKQLLKDVGKWPEGVRAYEDWEYLWRLGLMEPHPVHTNQTIFLYRQHGLQTTQNHSDDLQRDMEAVLVYEKIMANYFESYSSGWVELNWFKARISAIIKKYPSTDFFRSRSQTYLSLTNDLISFYLRLNNKMNRLKTGTSWSVSYGPVRSMDKINEWLSIFNKTK